MNKTAPSSQPITLFVPTLGGGGAERVMIMIANGLAEGGFEVDLVTGSAEGPYRDSVSKSVNLVDFGASRLLFSLPSFAKYLRSRKPQTVLSALGHANIANVFLSRLLSPKTKIVVSVHNSLQEKSPTGLNFFLAQALTGWSFSGAHSVVTVSREIRSQVLEHYRLDPSKVTAIYNPLDIQTISERAAEESGNEWLEQGSSPVILGVGRLTEQKNFEMLLRAFAKVREELPSRLIILGEGEQRNRLEEVIDELDIREDVFLPGFVSNPFAWVKKASVFVLSSKWEGLPGVLLEALACGTQVVSTDCKTGPREILEEGKWGALVEVDDHEELASAILESLKREEPIDTTIRAQDFSKENAVAEYRKVLASTGR